MGHYEFLQGTGVNMETYKISQIARLLGLSSDTIRFYEKKDWCILLQIRITSIGNMI